MPAPAGTLTSLERLLVALDGGEPDRVPGENVAAFLQASAELGRARAAAP
jgi:hypothetical protein